MARNGKGVSVIEMVVGLLVVIPLVLLLVDVMLITLGVQVNDHAAREAVRLAASGDPTQATSRAQACVDRLNKNSAGYVSNVTLKSLTFKPTNILTTEANLIPYGGTIQGSVTVITQVTITPVVISYVYSGPFNFQSSQTCPITYDVPNTAGGQPVAP